MMRHKGGQKVGKGIYWNIVEGDRIDIDDEGNLPGNEESTYVKLSSVLMLILGPVLGLAYVIILPFMAIGTVVVLLVRKVSGALLNLGSKIVYFEWRPTEAYLAGKKKRKRKKSPKTGSGEG